MHAFLPQAQGIIYFRSFGAPLPLVIFSGTFCPLFLLSYFLILVYSILFFHCLSFPLVFQRIWIALHCICLLRFRCTILRIKYVSYFCGYTACISRMKNQPWTRGVPDADASKERASLFGVFCWLFELKEFISFFLF